MDYKDTLLMPNTNFPMRGNLGVREEEFQKTWQKLDLYKKRLELNKDNKTFILHDGPPYANGNIHTGHVLNKTLKDIVIRFKSMRGFYTPYVPGWDTHGLPIENQITKSGVDRKAMSTEDFRKKCHIYALSQVEKQKESFKRIGILGDWDHPYLTMDKSFESDQIKMFGKLVEKNLVYKGLKPVFWSPSSETALAEAEIEYHNKNSESIYFTFPLTNSKRFKDVNLLIWTTTPWTLPANLAVSVNPRFTYFVVQADGHKYLILDKMISRLTTKLGWKKVEKIDEIKGLELEHLTYKHPLYERISPIVLGEHVTDEDGTGLVHTAPGHGEDDYIVGLKYNLEMLVPVNERGIMTKEAGKYEGEFYEKANFQIIEDLKKLNKLVFHETINHSYPHDWRTNKPLIFLATPQWFVSIDKIKDKLLSEINRITWTPSWGQVRMTNMIKDRQDWNISRQRIWGVPIPIFYTEKNEPIMDVKLINHVAEIFKTKGSNAWYELDAVDLLPKGYSHVDSPNGIFQKELDTLDVWFDAGTSHSILTNKKGNLSFPADLYQEGSDQYRGWFNSSLILSVAVNGVAPYNHVVTHGFILDKQGDKLSKSKGNAVDPLKIISTQGADIMRLWVATVDYQSDVRISDDIMKQVTEGYRKIRNTLRFMLGNLNDFNKETDYVSFSMRDRLTQSLHVKFVNLVNECIKSFETHKYDAVYRLVMPFITNEISSFFLDYAKDILYIEKKDTHKRLVIQSELYDLTLNLLKILTPLIPHTTSEAYWELIGSEENDIYLETINDLSVPVEFEKFDQKFDRLMNIREVVLKAIELKRADKVISKSAMASVTLILPKQDLELLNTFEQDFAQVFQVAEIKYVMDAELRAEVNKFDGQTCARCWNVVPKINHFELCPRCEKVLEE